MHPNATPPTTGDQLPTLGWHGPDTLDLAKFKPVGHVPHINTDLYTKPTGGLWTSPLREEGGIIGNSWVTSHGADRHDGHLWEVIPNPDARVYIVDNPLDLHEAIKTYPDPRTGLSLTTEPFLTVRQEKVAVIDWPALAKDFDAFYLTTSGVRDLNSPHGHLSRRSYRQPHIYKPSEHLALWDVPTVLWLQPAFTVGQAHPADPDTVQRFKAAAVAAEQATAIHLRNKVIKAATEQGVEIPEHILQLPPIGFLMVMAASATEEESD